MTVEAPGKTRKGVGASPARPDGIPKVTGNFAYASDLWADQMLWAATRHAPYASARVVRIDTTPALAMAGVQAVITQEDVPGKKTFGQIVQDQPVLADDLVRYWGEPVAVVAADDAETARLAAAAIEVEYEQLPALTDIEEAERRGSTFKEYRIRRGDEAATGSVVVEGVYETPFVDQAPLGTEAGLAIPDGEGGVDLGGIFRRLAFALRFADLDTLISSQLTADSKVLMERNIIDRVNRLAPFLYTDADPYLIRTDEGRLVWMVDMYSVTNNYPYSQAAPTGRLNRGSALPRDFNYIRNSVKATVDAFDGTVTLYVWDADDPVIKTQQKVFPGVFVDGAEMPEDIRSHLRYPEDLFRVQSDQYTLYHITDPRQFFSEVDPWEIARDPSTADRPQLRNEPGDGQTRPMLPYYLLMNLPAEEELSFIIMQPFTPRARPNMVSFLVAKSDADEYGDMIEYRLPAGSRQDGPGQVGDLINQTTEISAEFTLLGQGGSRVIQGSMLVLPIEQSVMYVQPIYIQAENSTASSNQNTFGAPAAQDTSGIPEFKRVVVSYNGDIQMRDSLGEALDAVFGAGSGDGVDQQPDPGGDPGVEVPEQVAALVEAAEAALIEADAALRAGDLGTYSEKVVEAQDLITRATALIDQVTAEE